MNKKLLMNFLIIGFILFLINKISKKSISTILDYFNKIKNIFCKILNIKNKEIEINKKENKKENKKYIENNLNEIKLTKQELNEESLKKNINNLIDNNIEKNNNIKDENEKLFIKAQNILSKNVQKIDLPLNVSIPKKCNQNDVKNIIKFLEDKYNILNVELNDNIEYYHYSEIYELKSLIVKFLLYNNKDLLGECEIEFNIIFKPTDDNNVFAASYNFNNKQGNFYISNFNLINVKETNNNIKLEKFDTNSIDSLIPDNIFSSEYEKDSSNYTTESQINLDTA